MIRLKVLAGPTPETTRVINRDTLEEVAGVRKVTWTAEAQQALVVTIELYDVQLEVVDQK